MVPPSHEVATKALEFEKGQEACDAWLRAANLYSIAAYPFIKGDELADQAIVLACKAYDSAAKFSQYQLKKSHSKWMVAKRFVDFFISHPMYKDLIQR